MELYRQGSTLSELHSSSNKAMENEDLKAKGAAADKPSAHNGGGYTASEEAGSSSDHSSNECDNHRDQSSKISFPEDEHKEHCGRTWSSKSQPSEDTDGTSSKGGSHQPSSQSSQRREDHERADSRESPSEDSATNSFPANSLDSGSDQGQSSSPDQAPSACLSGSANERSSGDSGSDQGHSSSPDQLESSEACLSCSVTERSSGSGTDESDSIGNRRWVYHYRVPVSADDPSRAVRFKDHPGADDDVTRKSKRPRHSANTVVSQSANSQEKQTGDGAYAMNSPSGSGTAKKADQILYLNLLRSIATDDHAAVRNLIGTIKDLSPHIQLGFHIFVSPERKKRAYLSNVSILHFAAACGAVECAREIIIVWPHTLWQEGPMLWISPPARPTSVMNLLKGLARELTGAASGAEESAKVLSLAERFENLRTIALQRQQQSSSASTQAKFGEEMQALAATAKPAPCVFPEGVVKLNVQYFKKSPEGAVEHTTLDSSVYLRDRRATAGGSIEVALSSLPGHYTSETMV